MNLEKNNREELIALLQNHSNLRTGQDQVLWGIFGAFWSANSLLLVSIFAADSQWNKKIVVLIISAIGLLVALVWVFIQNRALNRVIIYESAIKSIEEKLNLPFELCAFHNINEVKKSNTKLNARIVMEIFSYLCVILWITSLIISVIL